MIGAGSPCFGGCETSPAPPGRLNEGCSGGWGGAEDGDAFWMRSVGVDWGSGVVSVLGVLLDGFGEGERENVCLIPDKNFFPFSSKR